MKKVLKWIGIGLLILVVLAGSAVVFATVRTNSLLTKEWSYTPQNIEIPTDAESVANGKYLVEHFMLCMDCHGDDFGGQELLSPDDGMGILWAPNLTSGNGGIGGTYTDADWLRTLRHGIRPNGENLIIMPSYYYTKVDAGELGDMIAYLKTLPPVDREIPKRDLTLQAKILLGLGVIPADDLLPAQQIDHDAPPITAPPRAVSVEYGEYRANLCKACHGPDLAGAPSEGPGSPLSPNLTPGGELAGWTEADFLTTLQTGVTPSGQKLDPMQMPWDKVGTADPDDLRAIWLYLQSLPATTPPTQESGG